MNTTSGSNSVFLPVVNKNANKDLQNFIPAVNMFSKRDEERNRRLRSILDNQGESQTSSKYGQLSPMYMAGFSRNHAETQ